MVLLVRGEMQMSRSFIGQKTSDSLKALVGTAYEGKAVWAVVSSGGGFTDSVTYRCLGYRRGMNTAIPYNDITWSLDALNWGRNYGTTGLLVTTLDRNTVKEISNKANLNLHNKLRNLAFQSSLSRTVFIH